MAAVAIPRGSLHHVYPLCRGRQYCPVSGKRSAASGRQIARKLDDSRGKQAEEAIEQNPCRRQPGRQEGAQVHASASQIG